MLPIVARPSPAFGFFKIGPPSMGGGDEGVMFASRVPMLFCDAMFWNDVWLCWFSTLFNSPGSVLLG